jgi:hypothetical protein
VTTCSWQSDHDKPFGSFGNEIFIRGDLATMPIAEELHEAVHQPAEENAISADLEVGVGTDEAVDLLFVSFGHDWSVRARLAATPGRGSHSYT